MSPRPLFFLHGLESGPGGLKARTLEARFPQLVVPTLGRDPWSRHDFLLPRIPRDCVLVGSSLGGLSALLLARDLAPGHLAGMLLIAPAVGFCDPAYRTPELLELVAELVVPAGLPTVILAGLRDVVIPIEAIRDLVRRSPGTCRLHELDDEHRLNSPEAHRLMLQVTAELLNGPSVATNP